MKRHPALLFCINEEYPILKGVLTVFFIIKLLINIIYAIFFELR